MTLPAELQRQLDGAAKARHVTVEALALNVLRTVVSDGLVDAIIRIVRDAKIPIAHAA